MSLPSDQRAGKGCGVCAARDEFLHRGSGGVSSSTELHRSQPQAQLSALPRRAVEGGDGGLGFALSRSVFFLFWQRIGERKRGREKLPRRG